MNGLPGYSILLVEDNPVNKLLAARMLQQQGHAVTVADHGRAGLDAWRAGRFDLILMDVMMPEMDGLEATRQLRSEERERGGRIPIVAITANAMTGDRERCLAAGMDGYISKPYKAETLHQEIARVMGSVSAETAASQAAGPDAALPVFDRADALSRIGEDEELLATLLQMFVDDAPRYLAEIDAAAAAADWARLARGAHDLKGVLATFSARRSQELARQVEQACKSGAGATAADLLPRLRREVEIFLAALAG